GRFAASTGQLRADSDLAHGLSIAGGAISGTPTDGGNFLVFIRAADSGGQIIRKPYRVTIDNAAGQVPALSVTPRPIQVYYETGAPAPPPVSVSVATTSSALPFGLTFSGIPSGSLAAAGGTTSSSVNLTFNPAGLGTGTYFGLLAGTAAQSANQYDVVPVTLTVAPPPPCSYT